MPGILDGKTAIVTGAGRGIGRAMTLGLLDAGARVAAVELDAPALEETQDAAEDRGAGDRFFGMIADVAWDDTGPKATARHRRALRPRRYPHQQCRHQYRAVAPRGPADRQDMGDDAGRVPPHHRGQCRRHLPDDAGGVADAVGAALGPHHQRDHEPRHHVANHDAALWRLEGHQRGAPHRDGVRARRHWRHRECAGARRRRRHAHRLEDVDARSLKAHQARGDDRAARLAVLERRPMASTVSVSSPCAGTTSFRRRRPPKLPARRWPGSS